MKTAYLDTFSGISGDMVVGALLDAGLSLDFLRKELKKLGMEGYSISSGRVKINSISAATFSVKIRRKQKNRDYAAIVELIEKSALGDMVKGTSLDIFRRIAVAEAKVHGTTVERVHFHEVGAVDSIVDVVGAAIGFERLGIKSIECSPLPLGKGIVNTSHGLMPVPAPATLLILKGIPVKGGGPEMELVTPTGAAIAAGLSSAFGPMPQMKVLSVGYGAGSRERRDGVPNLLRLVTGESWGITKRLAVVETNIDDSTPEVLSHAINRLLEEGALDAWVSPVIMKKGRQAVTLSLLCEPHLAQVMRDVLLGETSTIGVRQYEVERHELPRSIVKVKTVYGTVRVKVVRMPDGKTRFKPEYDDCAALAKARKTAYPEIHSAAVHAAAETGKGSKGGRR